MANWQHTLAIKDEWKATQAGRMTVPDLAAVVARKLEALDIRHGQLEARRRELVADFDALAQDVDSDADDFDYLWDALYNWADTPLREGVKLCWIQTF